MRKIILGAIISVFLMNCQSSDDEHVPEISTNDDITLVGIGLDRLQFNGGFHGGWWEYKAKGDSNYTKTNFTDSSVIGLKPATTYELVYKNSKYSSKVYKYTTKALEFDYSKMNKENICLFKDRAIHTKKEYVFHTMDVIEQSNVDLYLINQDLTDSIKVSTKIAPDKKSIHFVLPETTFYNSVMPQITYLGFKAGDKMDYYFNAVIDSDDYLKNKYVSARKYKELKYSLAPAFFVENITPRLFSIKAVRSPDNKYTTIKIDGSIHDLSQMGNARCKKDYHAIATTLVIYQEDQKTTFIEVSRNKGQFVPPGRMNTFETFRTPDVPHYIIDVSLLQSSSIQYYTNILPKGKYYFQYKVLLSDGSYHESNKIEFSTNGIMQ